MRAPARPSERGAAPDAGRSLVEALVLGTLLLVPIIYLLFVAVRLQAATLAVAQASRDVARVMDTAPTVQIGLDRAHEIAALSLGDQSLSTDGLVIYFVPGEGGCDGAPSPPELRAGSVWTVCVRAVVTLPGVPTVLNGSDNTVTGQHVLRVGELRE